MRFTELIGSQSDEVERQGALGIRRFPFFGGLCIDEVHDSGRTILFATDLLNNFTVSFKPVEKNDQAHMDAFLPSLKDRGLRVEVALTDGSRSPKTVCKVTGRA
jgi:hypothetical protein